MMAAQAILDRGYGRPMQSIDANISEDRVRYIAEVPVKDKTTEEWLKGNAAYLSVDQTGGRSLISWDRYSDSSAVLACLLGPISPRPRHQSWEVPVPRRLLLVLRRHCRPPSAEHPGHEAARHIRHFSQT